jgi:hypothetical protein
MSSPAASLNYLIYKAIFNIDSKGFQTVSGTTRHLLALTRHAHPAYSDIEELIEGFVEDFLLNNPLARHKFKTLIGTKPERAFTLAPNPKCQVGLYPVAFASFSGDAITQREIKFGIPISN